MRKTYECEIKALLTHPESVVLHHCEDVIQRGMDSFVQVGRALIQIRDERLYRQRYRSFGQYVRERWGMSARHAYRQCDGAEIFSNLLPAPASPLPADWTEWKEDARATDKEAPAPASTMPQSESQVRPLKGLPAAEQKKAWNQAVKNARGAAVTAKAVQEIVESKKAKGWPKPDRNGCYDDEKAERFEFKHRSAVASLVVLQIGKDKWISRYDFKHFTGDHRAEIGTLKGRVGFTHRSYALKDAAGELSHSQRQLITSGDSGPEQKRIAQRIMDWAMEFVRGERGKLEENGAVKDITFEVEPKPRAKPREEKLIRAADQAIKDVRELLELTGMGSFHNVFLNTALERLEKFRDSLENSRATIHDGRRGL